MKVQVDIKLVKSSATQDELRRAIENFDPKVYVIAVFPSLIYKVKTTLTMNQLRAIFGVEYAVPVSEYVEVADICKDCKYAPPKEVNRPAKTFATINGDVLETTNFPAILGPGCGL